MYAKNIKQLNIEVLVSWSVLNSENKAKQIWRAGEKLKIIFLFLFVKAVKFFNTFFGVATKK